MSAKKFAREEHLIDKINKNLAMLKGNDKGIGETIVSWIIQIFLLFIMAGIVSVFRR